MTPDRRKEIQRSEDASYRTRTSREIDAHKERIKALESLLAKAGSELASIPPLNRSIESNVLLGYIDAILPATEVKKDEN